MGKILSFDRNKAKTLRELEFTKTWGLYNNVVDLAHEYAKEIIDCFNDYNRGEASDRDITTLLLRAQYSCYERGIADAYQTMQERKIADLNAYMEQKQREKGDL